MALHYVHGYAPREEIRLLDQAGALAELLHADTRYPAGSAVLEAGCGVGAQTVILARNSLEARFTSIDISAKSLEQARARVRDVGARNVSFRQADILDLPFAPGSFDHVFVCFVLEHLPEPGLALASLASRLRPGGSITVIEGDHGSAYFYPDGPGARRNIQCLVELQARAGGDGLVGRRLFPLLTGAGLSAVRVSPRMVYVDGSRPELAQEFTRNTFAAMVEGVRDAVLALGLVEPPEWQRGVEELLRAAEPDGVFCYTFFKAVGFRAMDREVAGER